MPKTIDVAMELVPIVCCACGVLFGMNSLQLETLQRTGQRFCCPTGHWQQFSETEADQLRKQLAAEAKHRERLETQIRDEREGREYAERRAAALRGVVTRTKNRIARGVCPCCNRSFANLYRHMQSQHPGYESEESDA